MKTIYIMNSYSMSSERVSFFHSITQTHIPQLFPNYSPNIPPTIPQHFQLFPQHSPTTPQTLQPAHNFLCLFLQYSWESKNFL